MNNEPIQSQSIQSQSIQPESIKEQLSALMDGELSRDETRFLLRRLDADAQLAISWSSYQIASDVLKKRFATPMRADFTVSVMQAVSAEQRTAARGGLLRWAGGGAIAAAVAVVALTAVRTPEDAAPQQPRAVATITAPVTTGPSTFNSERLLQSGMLPGPQPWDFTQSVSYDHWLMPRQNPNAYPPLMEPRNPQVIYYMPAAPKQ